MKVLHIIGDRDIGGAGRYLLTLVTQPAFRAFEVIVACPEGPLAGELKKAGVQVLHFEGADLSFSIPLVFRLYRLIRMVRPDLVHTHASLAGRLAARLAGVRAVVYTKHGLAGSEEAFVQVRGRRRLANALASRLLSDRIIAISRAVERELAAQGADPRRITVVYNGVDLDGPATGVSVRPAGIPEGDPLVGMVGRLSPEKGYRYFLEAAALVRPRKPGARFVIVGGGPERGEIADKVRELGLDGVLLMTGFRADVGEIMGALDVLVLASTAEGLGLVILEAMAAGKPVVATRVGGIPEAVEDGVTGLLVPPGDPGAMAGAILALAADRARAAEMGRAGRKRVEEKFSGRAMAEETARIYREVLGRTP